MGRRKSTGRYETREELEREVLFWWRETGAHQAAIARIVRASESTVAKIINAQINPIPERK